MSLLNSPFGTLRPNDVRKSYLYSSTSDYRLSCDRYIDKLNVVSSTKSSLEILKRTMDRRKYNILLRTESDDVSVMSEGVVQISTMNSVENMVDVGGEPTQTGSIGVKSNTMVSNVDLTMIGFLERPIQIVATSIALDTSHDFSYNVWDLFLADPVIRSKLRNFAFLRCNLNVKIAISGTPFHYGKLLVSYQPFPSVNQALSVFGPTFRISRLKYLSQAPGAKIMDIRDNVPFEFAIPYVSPQPVGRLFNNQQVALSDSQNYDDFTSLGTLYISTINDPKAVVATATSVSMYIYVYASEVSIFGTTGSLSVIETESDERKTGPVQKFATSAFGVSRALESVPNIGIFAKASTMFFGALKGISSLYGWSYPVINVNPSRVKNEPFQNGANTIGCDTGKRITLDPKQELSVDPRVVGVDQDELIIADICKRESYFDTFIWDPEAVPLVDLVWKCAVTPMAGKVDVVIPKSVCQPTPLSFAAMPFEYWRGSITYRLEFVCSNFHRGKFLIGYEPNIRQFDLISATLNVNKQYVKIIDLQETQSVEFTVEWNFPRSWARNITKQQIGNTVDDQYVDHSSYFNSCNGILFVTPFTSLQSPDDSSISINVYVRSDNMMFNRFNETNLVQFINPYIETESDTCCDATSSSLMEMSCCLLDPSQASSDHFGELPISFRALLKRFMSGSYVTTGDDLGGIYTTSSSFSTFPISNTASTANSSNKTLYQYLRHAYLAQRGSFRRRLLTGVKSNNVDTTDIIITLSKDSSVTLAPAINIVGGVVGIEPSGSVMFRTGTNMGVEFEIPCYTTNLFLWACNDDPWFDGPAMFQSKGLRNYEAHVVWAGDVQQMYMREYYATGEDFNLMRWIATYPIVTDTL